MKIKIIFLLLTILFVTTGCYGTLSGKIVDAETGAPIEGAVAMAEWTRTKGFGNTYTVSVKVSETVSDKNGNFELEGCYSPFVNKPDFTIYKRGYVAWNNVLIFPDWKKRESFEWKSGHVFGIEILASGVDFIAHDSFLNIAAKPYSATSEKNKFLKEYNEWERDKLLEQMKNKNK